MNDLPPIFLHRMTRVVVTAALGLLMALAGCREFIVEPDPAERAHPPESFRHIEAFDWQAVSESPAGQEPNAPGAEPNVPAELTLTIEECRAAALRHNLDLQVQLFVPLLSEQAVTAAEAVFEPLAFSQFDFVKTDSPTSLELDASKQEYASIDAGVQLPLRTGGTLSLDFPWN
ncbi:MAG: hypothetical protein JW810_09615, partial [Sedimentisphaerales bacterium]|nr:hypothetical protein [Sedimentisphaerales bacterium]